MSDPLVLPLAAVISGILLCRVFTFSAFDAAWPAVVFLLLTVFATGKLRRWCIMLALIFVGASTEAWHRPGPRPRIDAGSRETVVLTGCVVEPSVLSPGRQQFTLELDAAARARVSLPLEDDALPPRLEYGQRIEIEARIRPPRNFNNPGSFDYVGYLARQQIFWTAGMARGSAVRVLPGRCGWRAMALIFALRGAALDRIERLYPANKDGGAYTAGMMEAMLIGETSQLQKIWTENFRRTGTFHALVISGAHVAVLAGVLLFLLRICAMGEIPALAFTAAAAWLYALVSGFSPPVARAAGGFTLYLIARFFFRRGRVLNLLAAVALVYLLSDPGEMGDASFQLSFLCVAALGALATPLLEATSAPFARGLRDLANVEADSHLEPRVAQLRVEMRLAAETFEAWSRLPVRWWQVGLAALLRGGIFIYEMALVSLAIQIGLALPMAVYFHRISFTGLTANVIIVPLLEAAVPIGFLAIFSGWHAPALLAGWLLKIAARTADWHARMEPAWRVSNPPLWLALAFAASLIVFASVLRSAYWRKRAGVPAGFLVVLLFGVIVWQPWTAPVATHSLELTAIDVGQGDSLLIMFPDGRSMVIDGGGVLQFGRPSQRRRSNLDTGEDVVSPYLWSRGIRRIDILVSTHAHQDHSGGLAAILENFRPGEMWVGSNPSADLLRRAAELRIPVRAPNASGVPFAYGGARLEILSPPKDFTPAKAGNNDSLAFRITHGVHSFLLTGDMESPMERLLLADGRSLHADVLKVGHHGSKTSTTPDFLEAVSPSVAIISAGFENSFGHPTAAVLARLSDRHSAILRTDQDGLITVRSDGRKLNLDSMLWHPQSSANVFNWALALNLE